MDDVERVVDAKLWNAEQSPSTGMTAAGTVKTATGLTPGTLS